MKKNKLQKKPIKIGWQNLPRKRKKFSNRLLKILEVWERWEK
jgi:hypothetical protein